MRIDQLGISVLALAGAIASLVCVRSAIAARMVFDAAPAARPLEIKTSYQPETGVLTLQRRGISGEQFEVEVVSTRGRSPASVGISDPILKRLTLRNSRAVKLGARLAPGIIQVRVLAP